MWWRTGRLVTFFLLLSPLFLLFSDRFLPVRLVFCVCFVLLWPSVFSRLLCIISVLASVFLFVVSVYYLRLLCVRSSLFFLGFFPSFVLSAFACFSPVRPQFVPPGVFCSWVFSVLFVISVRPLFLSVCSQSSGLPPLRP